MGKLSIGKCFVLISFLLIFSILSILLYICFGPGTASAKECTKIVFQKLILKKDLHCIKVKKILSVFYHRLHRVILLILIGAGLAVSTCILQGLMENSFADPFLVGALPSGIFGISIASLAGMSALHSPMFAMLFIVIVLPIIYNLSKVDKKLNKQLLLLIGVGVSFILISLTVIFEIIGGKSLFQTLLWLMGTIKMEESLWRITPIWILPGIIACFYLAKHLDPLPKLTGPYYQARKIRSEMGKKCLLLFVAVLIGGIVPSAGIIAFFGFMITYPLKLLLQRSNRLLVLTSALAGASILPLLDLFSNLIFKETNLPVGVFTALIGTGVFIYFLKKTGPMELKFQSS